MRARLLLVPSLAVAVAVAGGAAPAVAQQASASVAGTVTSSADGRTLAGVCVQVTGETFRTVQTGADGRYRVTGLPAGTYEVGFNTCPQPLAGFAPEYFRDAASIEDAEPVVLRAGQARTDVGAALDPAAVIRGRLTDDDTGRAVADICVLAFDVSPEGFSFGVAEAGPGGHYALENLRAGEYALVFFDCSDPYLYRSELYDDVLLQDDPTGEGATTITVAAGQTREAIDAGLLLGGSLRGTVTGLHHGRPLNAVCLGLQGTEDDAPSALELSGLAPGLEDVLPPGQYVFGGLRPSSYDVVVDEDLCGDDGYQPLRQGPRQVRKGEVTAEVDLVLAPQPSTSTACFDDDPETSTFPDVDPRSVHGHSVDCVADYGIATGRTDGTYRPADPVRRDQMATFVAKTMAAAGADLPEDPRDAFPDDNGNVHEPAINQLAALGVVSGRDGRYAPAETVSRAQMATFLINAYERTTGFPLRAVRDAFGDDGGNVHEDRINKAATAGLAAGSGGRYSPNGSVRRDQMATFVARLLDRVQRDTAESFGETTSSVRPSSATTASSPGTTSSPGATAPAGVPLALHGLLAAR